MEIQPLDATWHKSSRVASCITLRAETAHDRPGSESSNLTTMRTVERNTKQRRNQPPTGPTQAVHLGDLLRIWVRPATKIILPSSDFQGPTRAFRTPQEGWCFTEASPLSPDKPIPGGGCTPNKEKRTLPRTLADISEVGCVTALGACRTKNARNIHQSPWTGSGILTRFPFVTGGCDLQLCTLMQ
ncbi:hypothetical protein MN116_008845 [Schistosoma mekongi]|uniref:Uncharacterized protein n=1 Tax=Schistosoma mekongi TaxID=38744 RepID=A0AAE2D1T2_SCHME|nr:hypothetical protein MN116_008880 [Schistosoma mekongi]KAK4467380.1 hypothetical protein MN116_008845 [Schistosoma mekongi]